MNIKEDEKVHKSKLNSIEVYKTIKSIPTNKNILFYRKSFLKNNKTSCYYHKKGNNSSNITPNTNNSYISGYKKPQRNLNYSNEEANQSTKGKTINCSKSKSKYDEITPEKNILNDKSISPLSIDSNNNSKQNKNSLIKLNNKENKSSLIKRYFDRKRENLSLNYTSKIHSISIVNNELKRNIKYDDSCNINKKQNFNFKPKRINELRNKVKKPINVPFKTDKNKESNNIVQNIQNSLNKNINYNNTNTTIINNTIKRKNNNNNNYSKTKKPQLTINKNVFDINNINNIEKTRRNLVKGKIIKFKYNGTEFFFEPIHNKTESFFYKNDSKNTKGDLITASNTIKKWWKRLSFINILLLKIKIKYGINLLNKIKTKRIFRFIKYKVLYLNKIIYIQKHWKEFINNKKEQTSFYKKNDTYGYDNSYRKNNEFLYMNNFGYVYSIEDNYSNQKNNNKIYLKKNKIKNKTDLINNFFYANLSNKKLITPKNETIDNEFINKNVSKNICFYSKLKIENNLEKIIFIQRKLRKFLKQKYYSFIRKIFKDLYSNKNISDQMDNNNNLNIKKEKIFKIDKQSFDILSKKIDYQNIYNIIKGDSFNYLVISPKQRQKTCYLDINKNNQISYSPKVIKSELKLEIIKNPYIEIFSEKNKVIAESKNEINFSILKQIKQEDNVNSIINKPIINNLCFYEKIKITNIYINSLIKIQKFFRQYRSIKNNKFTYKKIIQKYDCLNSKIYKNNKSQLLHILKIQKLFRHFLTKESKAIMKPINKFDFLTKIKKKGTKIKRYYKFIKNNNSYKTISPKEPNKNQIYFNNIDEFLYDKEGEKINDVTKYNTINNSRRKLNKERKINFLNDTDENKINENPIKIMNAKIHKSSINFNTKKITNLKSLKNNYTPTNSNKYINIESLPSINSLRTNTENNELFSLEQNKLNNNKIQNNITSISIQTLGSNLSKNKFRENIKYIKRMTTEGNNQNKNKIEYDIKNYFYTDNDIAKFSFNNGEGILFGNSIERKNTKNYFKLIRFINQRIIKIFCNKINDIKKQKCFYIFIKMIIKRIKKCINVFVFNIIFDRYNKNDFYKIIRKHIMIYNKIINDINIKNKYKNNELIVLIKENIFKEYFNNKFLFLYDMQEKNLIEKDVFISNDKDLINYFLLYYKYENKPFDNNYFNLIQFRLIKEPLYNMNIFSITKYMEILYNNIIHGNICKSCFCKMGESCSINCNCHIRQQNSINLINKIKNKITHHKSFNEPNKENNSFLEEKNKNTQRNIRITIKKVKRTSADTTRTRYDNSEQSNDSKNSYSNEIDIFQKMNAGIESIINKVKINKAFKDFNLCKKKKFDRTTTEYNGIINQNKIYSDDIYKVKNHFTTPNKKNSSFLIEKNY